MAKSIISLEEARDKSLQRYYTGKPCKQGHIAERRVINRQCVECSFASAAKRNQTDAYRAYHRNWEQEDRKKNPDKYSIRGKRRYQRHRTTILESVKAYQKANNNAINARKRAKYHSHSPEEKRRRALWDNYRLLPETYDQMYATQEGRCAICREHHRLLNVDHCHDTFKVRGLLCHRCNKGIGLFRDCPERLTSAIQYLIKEI